MVDIRLLFVAALNCVATSMIIAHNHPSGTLRPSQADKAITKKMQEAGRFLDIKVLDHLIITDESYYSFSDEGIL
jgi:DNA repair protein RadC